MREAHGIFAACALALAAPAIGSEEFAWLRTSSPDHAFSIETPCSIEELAKTKALPSELGGGVNLPQDGRVVCLKEGVLLAAGMVMEPALSKGEPSLFDQVTKSADHDPTAEGTPRLATINGHRAWLNRQQKDDVVAQMAVIEVGRSKIILGVTGGNRSTLKPAEQIAMIDRFYSSIQVAAK
jgi:hypothetical protein